MGILSRKSAWYTMAVFAGITLVGFSNAAAEDDGDVPPRGEVGHVVIKTTPEKAVAYMGGEKLGYTPIDTAFKSGRHTLTIMLNGEELVKERVNVWPGKTTTLEKELLMPYGSIVIKPNPINRNYKVTIDGEQVGYTKGGELTINRLESGTRVVVLSFKGRSHEFKVDVKAEGSEDIALDFGK
jgi:hypothetical protein